MASFLRAGEMTRWFVYGILRMDKAIFCTHILVKYGLSPSVQMASSLRVGETTRWFVSGMSKRVNVSNPYEDIIIQCVRSSSTLLGLYSLVAALIRPWICGT